MPKKKKNREIEDDDNKLQIALDAMWSMSDSQNSKINFTLASKSLGIPRTTLSRYHSEGVRDAKSKGRRRTLPPPFEKELAERVKASANACEGWTSQQLLMAAQMAYNLCSEDGQSNSDPPKFSDTWLRNFCERNDISMKLPVKLSKSRFEAVNRSALMSFIALVESFVSKNNIPAENIWTCDETTSIPKKGDKTKLLSAVGKPLFDKRSPIKVPKFSLLCCVSAAGDHIPPMILMPCASEKKRMGPAPTIGPEGSVKGWKMTWSPKGAMTTEIFSDWLVNDFAEKIRPKIDESRWVLLLMDNCSSHYSSEAFQILHEKKIAVGFFVPNSTHLASPLDVSVYGPLKTSLSRSLGKRSSLSKANLGDWIEPAFKAAFTSRNIVSGFHATGIWNQVKNGPDFLHVSSQYHSLLSELDAGFKKKNEAQKKKELLEAHSKRLSDLLEEEEGKLGKKKVVIGGSTFRNRALSGSIVGPEFLAHVEAQCSTLQSANEMRLKEDKIQQDALKKLHKEKLKALTDDLRKERKGRLSLEKKYDKLLKKHESCGTKPLVRSDTVLEELSEITELTNAAFQVLSDNGISADSITSKLIENGASSKVLKRNRSFCVEKRASKRKRKNPRNFSQ